jgi:hypothetical protein
MRNFPFVCDRRIKIELDKNRTNNPSQFFDPPLDEYVFKFEEDQKESLLISLKDLVDRIERLA